MGGLSPPPPRHPPTSQKAPRPPPTPPIPTKPPPRPTSKQTDTPFWGGSFDWFGFFGFFCVLVFSVLVLVFCCDLVFVCKLSGVALISRRNPKMLGTRYPEGWVRTCSFDSTKTCTRGNKGTEDSWSGAICERKAGLFRNPKGEVHIRGTELEGNKGSPKIGED